MPGSESSGFPDGATSPEGGGIAFAWFENLSDEYGHGVLGDALEPTRLRAWSTETSARCGLSVDAGMGHVFEDIAPRLADVDGDGAPEVIVVRSSFSQGAQLAIYGQTDSDTDLILQAATPYIGRPFRWLAPAAWADLDGDGRVELAYIDRPHLAKILRVWRYEAGQLVQVATIDGVTNHRIGEPFISGGIRDCGDGREIVLATADWSGLVTVRFDGRRLTANDLGNGLDFDAALSCRR
ncbi:MAG: VCBS repeat-containing protein [Pseudomonadota bacterium]